MTKYFAPCSGCLVSVQTVVVAIIENDYLPWYLGGSNKLRHDNLDKYLFLLSLRQKAVRGGLNIHFTLADCFGGAHVENVQSEQKM